MCVCVCSLECCKCVSVRGNAKEPVRIASEFVKCLVVVGASRYSNDRLLYVVFVVWFLYGTIHRVLRIRKISYLDQRHTNVVSYIQSISYTRYGIRD